MAGDSTKDKTYKPRRAGPQEEDDPHIDDPIFNSDGEEYVAPESDDGGDGEEVGPVTHHKKVSSHVLRVGIQH